VGQMINATVGQSAPERMQAVRAAALPAGPLPAAGGDGGEGATRGGCTGVLHPGVVMDVLSSLANFLCSFS
jgi:hypothetical protein